MPIWGNRDKEEVAEDQPVQDQAAGAEQEGGTPAGAATESGEPAPAFWRAQGEAPDSFGGPEPTGGAVADETMAPGEPASARTSASGEPRSARSVEPAEAPASAGDAAPASAGTVEPAEAPAASGAMASTGRQADTGNTDAGAASAPPISESPAGTDAPPPVLAEEIVVIDEEAAVKDPSLETPAATSADADALTAGSRESGSVAARTPAADAQGTGSPASAGALSPQRWSEIMATFVDDPRGSVKMAADAVDSAVEELVSSVRGRQQALASSWQGNEADTEQLRNALREYRRFGAQLPQMSPGETAGA